MKEGEGMEAVVKKEDKVGVNGMGKELTIGDVGIKDDRFEEVEVKKVVEMRA